MPVVGRTDKERRIHEHAGRCGANLNATNHGGQTALAEAAEWGYRIQAWILLEKGADLRIADDRGSTPLSYALLNSHVNLASMLLRYGVDPDAKDREGDSELLRVVRNRMD